MMLALLLSLAGSATPNAAAAGARIDDPPIKVWLNHDDFQRGDKARVNVRVADDGYLIVLRADARGRVRVLFPLDPSDDAFVRGGKTVEVRGRGDREAFSVDDGEGSGLVLAARAVAPFKFDEFVRGDHWDYRVLSARESGDDKEAALVDIVQRMAPDGHFDYDAVTYVVAAARNYSASYYPGYSGLGIGFGWGWPYRYRYGFYSTCYDPFYYDPFVCYDPFPYLPYRYGFSYGYGYRRIYRPFIYGGYAFPNRQRGGAFIARVRTGPGVHMYFKDQVGANASVGGIGPRFRVPQGTLVARARPTAAAVRERAGARRDDVDRQTLFSGRDRPEVRDGRDRPSDRSPSGRDRPEARDGGDRPSDRSTPAAREPERRGRDGGRDPGASSAPRAPSGGDRRVAPPPRAERSSPPSRGGDGGGSRGSSGEGRRGG
ncbi:MAG TPA: DUF4384 domain-containing protein, partial [Gemmatimonadales bacterium]|nr:DUF4384 domain-containing protein [Gemmatimonadales bacterium]